MQSSDLSTPDKEKSGDSCKKKNLDIVQKVRFYFFPLKIKQTFVNWVN